MELELLTLIQMIVPAATALAGFWIAQRGQRLQLSSALYEERLKLATSMGPHLDELYRIADGLSSATQLSTEVTDEAVNQIEEVRSNLFPLLAKAELLFPESTARDIKFFVTDAVYDIYRARLASLGTALAPGQTMSLRPLDRAKLSSAHKKMVATMRENLGIEGAGLELSSALSKPDSLKQYS